MPLSVSFAVIRFQPRPRIQWIPTIAALVVVVIGCAAGQWQTGRAEEKDVVESRHAALFAAPALQITPSLGGDETDQWDGRRLLARGSFVNDKTVFLDNQIHQRQAGYHVLTPFRTDRGAVVLVNRGWVPQGASRAQLPPVPDVNGIMSIEGRGALPPRRVYEIKPEAQQGKVWQNLQLQAMSKQAGLAYLPVVLRLASDVGDGLIRMPEAQPDRARQDMGAGMTAAKHRGYAFQWYALAALAVVLFVFFTFFERSKPDDTPPRNA